MSATAPFFGLLLLLAFVAFPIWVIFRIIELGRARDSQGRKLALLEDELRRLRSEIANGARPPTPTSAPPATVSAPVPTATAEAPRPVAPSAPAPHSGLAPVPLAVPPPVVPVTARREAAPPLPPPIPVAPPPVAVSRAEVRGVNWEQFMGAKIFAWLGGLAGLLAVGFFVKYSFEHDLIPPEVRVAIGFLTGLALMVAGLKIDRARYAVTAQTLVATGIVSLYTVTFACRSVYHFAFFGPVMTFLLMVVITAAAFLLAVRMMAQVVAILGMLGGFLTPVLLSTGQDNPFGLFSYLALLDLGLIAVALHRSWPHLVALGATGSVTLFVAWYEHSPSVARVPIAMGVALGFCALFLGAYLGAARLGRPSRTITWSAIALPFVAFAFALHFLGLSGIAARPGLLFTYVLAADLGLLVIAWCDDELPQLHLAAGAAAFLLLALWTGTQLTEPLLPWALGFCLLYAALHTAFPVLLERQRPAAAPAWWSQLFPPATLLVLLLPLFRLPEISLLFWPGVLLVDLLAIGLALATASLVAVAAVLCLTLVVAGVWIFRVPVTAAATPEAVIVIGGFALLFFAAGLYLARRLGARSSAGGAVGSGGELLVQIPALSALLPFVLLVMMTARLPLPNPSPVFGLALLLTVMVLGLTRLLVSANGGAGATRGAEWLPACALAGLAGLEYAWHLRHFEPGHAAVPLAWYLGFYALFTAFPFAFRAQFSATTGPWAVAALAGVLQFPLVHRVLTQAWPHDFPGLWPALFAVAPLASLATIVRRPPADEAARLNQLAAFGAAALLFITLIFPIQFERQWLTLAWALEGAALLWLFPRVPHPGLRVAGVALLAAAFVRLALNPAVLGYHARGDLPILNWYLYTYGIVTLCLFVGASLAVRAAAAARRPLPASPHVLSLLAHTPGFLNTLGTVLAFLLVNIEIADFFSAPGQRVLTFSFSGHFGRDMTYTIAWSVFALALLLVSIWKQARPGRYAAQALLGAAVLKLFFHDLARLDALYRIGALLAVAIIATLASFAYQRFLPANDKASPPASGD